MLDRILEMAGLGPTMILVCMVVFGASYALVKRFCARYDSLDDSIRWFLIEAQQLEFSNSVNSTEIKRHRHDLANRLRTEDVLLKWVIQRRTKIRFDEIIKAADDFIEEVRKVVADLGSFSDYDKSMLIHSRDRLINALRGIGTPTGK